jgi:hypothetical protein
MCFISIGTTEFEPGGVFTHIPGVFSNLPLDPLIEHSSKIGTILAEYGEAGGREPY